MEPDGTFTLAAICRNGMRASVRESTLPPCVCCWLWLIYSRPTHNSHSGLLSEPVSSVLQVCGEKRRFEKLMEYFRSEESNLDFMVRLPLLFYVVFGGKLKEKIAHLRWYWFIWSFPFHLHGVSHRSLDFSLLVYKGSYFSCVRCHFIALIFLKQIFFS